MKDNIILIGFMGCGKTTMGKVLSKELSYRHVDTDKEIEKNEGCSIKDIFKKNGEEYFRRLETETIRTLGSTLSKSIVSTGGGLPLNPVNADILKKMGFVVYLNVNEETVWQRLKNDKTRPLLQKPEPEKEIRRLLEYRNPLYVLAAHLVVEADGKTMGEIASEILRNYDMVLHAVKRGKEWKG